MFIPMWYWIVAIVIFPFATVIAFYLDDGCYSSEPIGYPILTFAVVVASILWGVTLPVIVFFLLLLGIGAGAKFVADKICDFVNRSR